MKLKEPLLYWLAPETDAEVSKVIDCNNLRSVHVLSMALAAMESVALVIYFIMHLGDLGELPIIDALLRVFIFILGSIAACILSDKMLAPDGSPRTGQTATNVILTLYFLLNVLWGMYVSVGHYKKDEQMVTFYAVLLCIVFFFRLRPVSSALVIGVSSVAFFCYLEIVVKPGKIQPINYTLFILLLLGGSIVSYRVSVNNIRQKLRIQELNGALEEIANHDNLTRLKNRHALSQNMPSYIGSEICIAMLDINKFKFFNDTYGHKKGDEILCLVADILTQALSDADIYRYGGDEFLIIAKDCTQEAFLQKLEECNANLGHYSANKGGLELSFAYGVTAITCSDMNVIQESISEADKRLYEHKKKSSR